MQFIKGGWINRNFILASGKKSLLTLQLRKASPNKLINEIEIGDNFKKKLKTISQAYAKAPFYDAVFPLVEALFASEDANLATFLFRSIQMVADYLGIKTTIVLSSTLDKNNDLAGQSKVLDICRTLKADTYVNAIGGQELYSQDAFSEKGIRLLFLKSGSVSYRQFNGEFVANLSMLDVLMFNSPDEIHTYLSQFELIQ